jgi:hypothetical protein
MTTAFEFNSVALSTYGKVTMINDYLEFLDARGENKVIPYRHGAIFSTKYFGERTITFGIAMTAASATALETLFDTMRAAFAVRTQQVLKCTLEDTSIRNANATVNKPIQVNRITNTFARVVVEFDLADPIFRGDTAIPDNTTTIDTDPHNFVVNNTGTIEERDPKITIVGPFSLVTFNSPLGWTMTYTGAIDAGENVVIGTLNGEYYATHNVDGNVIGNVTHGGSAALMTFNPGETTLEVYTTGGDNSGTVRVEFYPPFI